MRKIISLASLLTFLLLLIFSRVSSASELQFYSASPGGSWYPMAVALGNLFEKNVSGLKISHKPGGGVSNVVAVDTGKGEIGMSTSVSIGDGLLGNPPFKGKHTGIRALATFYPTFWTLTVWKDSTIQKLSDLKGKRLAPGIKGYTSEAVAKNVLEFAGVKYGDLAKIEFVQDSQAVDLMKDGHIDAIADTSDSLRDPVLVDASMTRPIRILNVPNNIIHELQKTSPGLIAATIPKGVYNGIDADVQTIVYSLGMIVKKDLPDDLVYQITKVLAENWIKEIQPVSKVLTNVQPADFVKPLGVELHPGAAKYYRERGWIK